MESLNYTSKKILEYLPLGLTFFATYPLISFKLIKTHDFYFPIFRLYALNHEIFLNHQIPPRWLNDFALGYGYPFFNYYAPFAYYLALLFFRFFSLGYIFSIHAVFIAGFIIAYLSTYWWVKEILGPAPAVLSALVYVFFPYRLVQVYVRGAFSEFLASCLFPLVFFLFWRLIYRNIKKSTNWFVLVGSGLFYGLIILTHNIMALIFTPILLAYVLLLIFKCRRQADPIRLLLFSITAFLIGLGISSFFWIPALLEIKYVHIARTTTFVNYKDHFVHFFQLFLPNWGFGGSYKGINDGMSFQIGIAPLFFSFLSLFLYKRFTVSLRVYYLFSWIIAILIIFLMLPYSNVLWEIIKPMAYIQLPWRMLALLALPFSLISGFALYGVQNSKITKTFLIILPVISVFPYIWRSANKDRYIPLLKETQINRYYIWNTEIVSKTFGTTLGNEYLPKWVYKMPTEPAFEPLIIYNTKKKGKFFLKQILNRGIRRKWLISCDGDFLIKLNTFFFPGWRIYVNKAPAEAKINSDGTITLFLPAGDYIIEQIFKDTLVRTVSNCISALVLLIILSYVIIRFSSSFFKK